MNTASPKTLSVAEVAKALKLHESRVRQLCRAGRLGTRKSGVWIIFPDELRRFAKQKRLPGRPKARAR